jgi:hypothetical protein
MSDTATSGAAAPVDAAPSQTATTSNAGSWRETLPADLRDNPSLRSINDIPSLAKSYVHAQSLVGADKVVIPKDNASQEEWSNFFSKLGRPENFPEQYFDADMNNHMMQVFHESGLSSKQAKLLHSKYMEYVNTRINQNTQQAQQQSEQAIAALKQQYGPDFNVRVAAAQRAIQRFGSQELISYLDKSGLGNNPELIKLTLACH